MARIRKGDTVAVIAGKHKGARGKVLRVLNEQNRVVIERVAMVKRHTKPTQQDSKGGIIEKEGTIAIGKRYQVSASRTAAEYTPTSASPIICPRMSCPMRM